MRLVLVLITLVIAHQAQSLTQGEIDEWMPYILNHVLNQMAIPGKKLETSLNQLTLKVAIIWFPL